MVEKTLPPQSEDLKAYRLEIVEKLACQNEKKINSLTWRIGLMSGMISALASYLFRF